MKHIELLNLLCKQRKILDEAYKQKKLISVPKELVEIGLFIKIDEYYYLNEIYLNFINTLLNRSEIDFVFEDFEKELKRLIEYKNEYFATKNSFYLDGLYNLSNKIFQGMKNRDKMILGLIVSFERDNIREIDILIKETTRILGEIENLIDINKKIANEFDTLKETALKEFIKDILVEVVTLNRNIEKYLNRLKEFIIQTEKKRIFNKKLQKIANLILKEDARIEDFLKNKDFVVKEKIISVPDIIDMEIVKRAVGKLFIKKEIKKVEIKKPIEEVVRLIDVKKLIEKLPGSIDVFKSVLDYIEKKDKKFMVESVRVFVYVLNHYDKNIIYTDKFNEFNVRICKWK